MGTHESERPKTSLFSNLVVGLRGGFDDRQYLEGVKSDGTRQLDKLNDVNSALSAFDTGHERLVMPEFDCQFFLAESCFIPGVDQRLAQSLLTFASDCFRHASHTFCDVSSGLNLLSKK
jgi:hypothetical protein